MLESRAALPCPALSPLDVDHPFVQLWTLPARQSRSGRLGHQTSCRGTAVPVFGLPVFYVIMALSSGNSAGPERSCKVTPVSEKVKVLDLVRHFISLHHYKKKDEYSTI